MKNERISFAANSSLSQKNVVKLREVFQGALTWKCMIGWAIEHVSEEGRKEVYERVCSLSDKGKFLVPPFEAGGFYLTGGSVEDLFRLKEVFEGFENVSFMLEMPV